MTNIFKIKSNPHFKPLQGWAAYDPKGNMAGYVVRSRAFAQSSAAQNFVPTNSWTMPDDWHRAKKAGWKVARVMVVAL